MLLLHATLKILLRVAQKGNPQDRKEGTYLEPLEVSGRSRETRSTYLDVAFPFPFAALGSSRVQNSVRPSRRTVRACSA